MPVGDLAPELSLLLGAVAILLAAIVLPQRRLGVCAGLALAALAVAAGIAVAQFDARHLTFEGTFALDGATGMARLMIAGFTALVVGLSPAWFATDRRHGEFYAMLLFSALGAMAMAGAADLMQLVMGVLLSSVTGYVLAAYHRDWAVSLEAGMKYFLVGALANALLVIGVALVLGMAGTTDYARLSGAMPGDAVTTTGVALILLGLFFKIGAAPAHAWVPDVAEGAPLPSALFLTVVPKIAGAIALYRFVDLVPEDAVPVRLLVAVVAAATMTIGNLTAMWQDDLRRLMGWSSVSQAGYVLMAVAVAGRAQDAPAALIGFLLVYGIANTAAFAVVARLRGRTALDDWRGLIRQAPGPVTVLVLAFLSLVGLPPLAGFLGKFALFLVTLDGGLAWLAVVAVANTVLSLFYYLRVIGPAVLAREDREVQTLSRGAAVVVWSMGALLLLVPLAWNALWQAMPQAVLP